MKNLGLRHIEVSAQFIGIDKVVPTEDIRKELNQQSPWDLEKALVALLYSTVGAIFTRQGSWLV